MNRAVQRRDVAEADEDRGVRSDQLVIEELEQLVRVVAADRAHDRAHLGIREHRVEIGRAVRRRARGPPGLRARVLTDADAEAAALELGDATLEPARHAGRDRRRRRDDADEVAALEPSWEPHYEAESADGASAARTIRSCSRRCAVG